MATTDGPLGPMKVPDDASIDDVLFAGMVQFFGLGPGDVKTRAGLERDDKLERRDDMSERKKRPVKNRTTKKPTNEEVFKARALRASERVDFKAKTKVARREAGMPPCIDAGWLERAGQFLDEWFDARTPYDVPTSRGTYLQLRDSLAQLLNDVFDEGWKG